MFSNYFPILLISPLKFPHCVTRKDIKITFIVIFPFSGKKIKDQVERNYLQISELAVTELCLVQPYRNAVCTKMVLYSDLQRSPLLSLMQGEPFALSFTAYIS